MEDLRFLFNKKNEEENLISDGDTIILGLSGGADSVSLLYLLLGMSKDISIFAIHINHNLRNDESDRDERFVRMLCSGLDIELKVVNIDCKLYSKKHHISLEEAGRIARYEAFDTFADELFNRGLPRKKIKIATAHNSDDQVETVFFRFLRGSSIEGLSGISTSRYSRKGYCIIRPILSFHRRDIEAFCTKDNIEFVNDSTNYENDYTRNLIRNDMIPSIEKKIGADISSSILRFADIARYDSNFISKQVDMVYRDIVSKKLNKAWFDKRKVISLDRAVSSRLIFRLLKDVGIDKDLQFSIIENILNLISEDKGYRCLDLPKDFIIEVSYNDVFIHKKKPTKEENIDFSRFSFRLLEDEASAYNKGNTILVPEEFIKNDIEIRTRRTGDYIYINPYSKKTIKKLFIDEKIPQKQRDKILLIASGNNVFYIHGENGIKLDVKYGISKAKYITKFDNKKLVVVEII